ncbi:uncharacterized protein LOC113508305 [Trichoplusia ni]|uniref:Uncharacterized protein LOC113508305 n=1 Tax=Trichoplusia ni TaxID=7111 RepID=A0A7E5X3V3_TRINI|nr:uncharacterized protein LOC113508305 [Trichoplusia ni]XP_026747071.1 uncharacterized protein LOC113508305 [Trichoplusia ni]
MNSMNASGVPHRQQWRNDIGMRNLPTLDSHRETIANHLNRNHVVAGTICCSRSDCDKVKWEQLEKVFRREGGSPIFPQYSTTFPACRDNPGTKKDANGFPENFSPAYCPCVVNRAHLVAYCCVRRDCDDASKIGGRNERTPAFSHFKY